MGKGEIDHDGELEKFLAGKQPVDLGKTLATLPRTANIANAVRAVLQLVDHPHWLFASCLALPAAVIRGVLGAEHPGTNHLFLRLAVPRDAKATPMKAAWQAAVRALHELGDTTAPWEERRAMQAKLAKNATVLAALQGLVAHSTEVPLDMLAVLAIDGGEASVDALIPHLDPALGERDARLEQLGLLRDRAKRVPALDALFGEVGTALADYRKASPVLALAKVIGLAQAPDVFWFRFRLASDDGARVAMSRYQGNVRVDSREEPWFECWLSGEQDTRFDDTRVVADGLGIGACKAEDLPRYLAFTANRLGFRWQPFFVHASAERERITEWLNRGGA